jgi:hypothetical protein
MTATSATVAGTAIRHVGVGAYRIATDAPESDGTIAWDATTIVVVEVLAGDCAASATRTPMRRPHT